MENKWKKKYQLIIWTITLVIVVCALIYHFGEVLNLGCNDDPVDMQEFDFTGEDVKRIVVELDAANVEVTCGDKLSVSHNIPEKYAPEIKNNGDTLTVSQKSITANINPIAKNYKVEVVVPKNTVLTALHAEVDAGNVEVTALNGDAIRIEIDKGNINISDSEFDSSILSADMGNIQIESSNLGQMNYEVDMGNVSLQNSDVSSGEIITDIGNITIDGNIDYLYASSEIGSIEITTPNPEKAHLKLECEIGSASVNGEVWK